MSAVPRRSDVPEPAVGESVLARNAGPAGTMRGSLVPRHPATPESAALPGRIEKECLKIAQEVETPRRRPHAVQVPTDEAACLGVRERALDRRERQAGALDEPGELEA